MRARLMFLASLLLLLMLGVGVTTASAGPHDTLTWTGDYGICKGCHLDKYQEVFYSVHYQWKGNATDIINGPSVQGKIAGSMNAYCINILGNFTACGSCHIGRGNMPSSTYSDSELNNIDCFICHHKDYKRVRNATTGLFEPAPGVDMNTIVKTVHRPVRANCLQCHAKAGGGDGVKRTLTMAHASTTDKNYDVHMATTGANLQCQNCHLFTNHRVAGRGSELRARDRSEQVTCANSSCHSNKLTSTGHKTTKIDSHRFRVACQTCHIPVIAKNAADTAANEATEIQRDWRTSEWNATLNRYEPSHVMANNVTPRYSWFNGKSWVYNLGDPAVYDSKTGAYQISRPQGSVLDTNPLNKIYPFKYKTSYQPITTKLSPNVLIALSTKDYFATGNYAAAVQAGLVNMGLSSTTAYTTVLADEYQMVNHQVSPVAYKVVACAECHPNSKATRMKLVTDFGYGLKADAKVVCTQCHGLRKVPAYDRMHKNHVDNRKIKCSRCHNFDRPERTDLVN